MRTVPKWVNKIHEADRVEFSSVHSLCFSPDGTQLVVAAGEKVMVYDPRDGALIQLLQAHKGEVHAVAYCGDGKKFASGSADKNVIIWTSKMEGVLKYSHSEAIQCLAYNPVTKHLVSCALTDFAFWSMDVKAVQKYRLSGRITCCAWSSNGQHLAIGLASGVVSLRDKSGEETHRIARDAAVWAVVFSKSTLLVTDWNETLSFYNMEGQALLKERKIGIAPLSVSLLGTTIVVGGTGGWSAFTAEGVPVAHTDQDWVWCVAPSPSLNVLAVACQDGTLWCYQIVFSTVHGLYRERYAYRENMTDVIIQHLTTGNKVRIKCHDRVQKIAIYKNRLAVQLPERVVVYEQGDVEGMLYRVKDKFAQRNECSLLVSTSDALLICQDAKLSIIGRRIPKFWMMPAPIRYVKVTTLYFEEVLLLGLMNGQIWQVEPSNGKCKMILLTPASVRCLDVSASRANLAVVDEASICRIYNLPTGDLLHTEENISSVSWNSWCDELVSMSGGGLLSIKAGSHPPATQPQSGSVVGFQGGRVFCLQADSMQTVNVPLSHAVHQYIEQKLFGEAYAVACLGLTALGWERLGFAALEKLSLEVARKAFQRSENIIFLTLIDHLQERLEAGEKREVIIGEMLAYLGRYTDAARSYRAAGRDERALNMFVDLRMFNKAQDYVGEGEGLTALARRRAEWARHMNEPRAAAEMYLAAGDVRRAALLMAETGRRDMLIELARKLDKGSSESLRHVAEALISVGEHATAADLYERLADYNKVGQLAVAANEWSRAFALAKEHPECKRDVYLPYANRMAQENKFVEAQKAYYMAGETATAMRVFSILVGNAVCEERFADAGYLHHLLASQSLDSIGSAEDNDRDTCLRRYAHYERLARIYHAYDSVHRCVNEPFSLIAPDTLLNAARYVLALVEEDPPPGISIFAVCLCIAKQAKVFGASHLTKLMLDKILGLQIPLKFQESVELLVIKSRGLEGAEFGSCDEDVMQLCWRCRRHAVPLTPVACAYCGHAFVHTLATHEVLPLVQFEPIEGISHEEALDLISQMPLPATPAEPEMAGVDILRIDDNIDCADPFLDKVEENWTKFEWDHTESVSILIKSSKSIHPVKSYKEDESRVVVCSRAALLQLNPAWVVEVRRPLSPPVLYRNMLPELPATVCQNCHNLFYLEDYEVYSVLKGQCLFCRHSVMDKMKDDDESEDSLANDSIASTPASPSNGIHSWR